MKQKAKGKSAAAQSSHRTTTQTVELSVKENRRLSRIAFYVIVLCGFFLYVNTWNHGYVLDDYSVIKDNKLTTQGVKALPEFFKTGLRDGNFLAEDNLYRPLTKTLFAAEWDLAPDNPSFAHGVNIMMYALLCGFLFFTLLQLMPGQLYLSFIASLIFTFHPIHTEVVANIKSVDEIMSLFLVLASIRAAHVYAREGKTIWLLAAIVAYMMALFTKENAITFLLLIPVTLFFFSDAGMRRHLAIGIGLTVVTMLYLMIHKNVIGMIGVDANTVPVVDNSLLATKSFMEQRMTAIYILGLYIKLLFIPHPLSCDYSFNTIPLVTDFFHTGFILSLVLHLGMLYYAVVNLKKKSIPAYAIWFYLITISVVSNVFALIGTNMADRLVFFPSVGFSLLIAWIFVRYSALLNTSFSFGKLFAKPAILFILTPVLLLFSFKTIERNKDWKSDATLYDQDVKTVPNSAHMLYYHAGMIAKVDSLNKLTPDRRIYALQQAEQELQRALAIYEPFPNVHALLGRVYKDLGKLDKAIFHYERTLQLNANDATSFNNYATCLFTVGNLKAAEVNFKKAMEISPFCYNDAICNLGSVYGVMGNNYLQMGSVDSAKIHFEKAIDYFNQTIACDEHYAKAYKFIGFSYQSLGDTVKANQFFMKFDEVYANNEREGRTNVE